jgi:hypothetical protein
MSTIYSRWCAIESIRSIFIHLLSIVTLDMCSFRRHQAYLDCTQDESSLVRSFRSCSGTWVVAGDRIENKRITESYTMAETSLCILLSSLKCTGAPSLFHIHSLTTISEVARRYSFATCNGQRLTEPLALHCDQLHTSTKDSQEPFKVITLSVQTSKPLAQQTPPKDCHSPQR